MELAAVELLLWLGFALMIWALKDSLHRMESDLRDYQFPAIANCAVRRELIATPQHLIEPMGWYMDRQIYRYAIIDGRHYRFEHVSPAGMPLRLQDHQRWVAPGLVYTEAPVPAG